jgi:hypothetical protein
MFSSDRSIIHPVALRVSIILFIISLFSFMQPAQAAVRIGPSTFTVDDTGDQPDDELGDYVCATAGNKCTLRAAIQQANHNVDAHDTINFDNDVVIIKPSSGLPDLTDPLGVTIYSDHDLQLNGTNVSGDGLTVASNNNEIMGLTILSFDNGVVVTGNFNTIGTDGDGVDDAKERNVIYSNDGGTGYGVKLVGGMNVVAGNYIGVITNGEDKSANTTGVYVSGNNNRIGTNGDGTSDTEERNVISGNDDHGIVISGDNSVVAGNYIGLKKDGDEAQANGSNGIVINAQASYTRVGTNSNGVGDTAERNVISGNGVDGIKNYGDNTTIMGNYIGTNSLGNGAIPNGGYGVAVSDNSEDAVVGTNGDGTLDYIEGNTISGNTLGGVEVSLNNQRTWIAGNKIGTNPAGTTALANQGDGVYAVGSGDDLVIGTNGDGTADVNERNVISGNTQNGVHLGAGMTSAAVAGNHIGTNAIGTAAIGNGANGVLVDGGSSDHQIGSDVDGTADTQERNLISGNTESGVRIEGDGSDMNKIIGNYIGTNVSGNSALGNNIGVRVDDQAYSTIIGGSTSYDYGNLISGNTSDGIYIGGGSQATEIWFNVIGMNYLSLTAVSNGRHGIYLTTGAFDSLIQNNTIAHNTEGGIFMSSIAGTGNKYVYQNSIHDNGGLGVDLAPDGVNPNDPGDGDSGPNDLMNYPVFTRLVTDGIWILVEGLIDSEPDQDLDIWFYPVEDCDPSGYGEGGIDAGLVQYETVKTNSSGIGVIASLIPYYDVEAQPFMVMSTGYSEFSECKLIETGQIVDVAQLSIADSSQDEGDSGVTLMDFDVTLNHTTTITVSVEYSLEDGTAKAGQDYNDGSGTIEIPPGTTKQTISVEIIGDTVPEPNETYLVKLRSPVGAEIQDSQATGTIINDDDDDDGVRYWIFLPMIQR